MLALFKPFDDGRPFEPGSHSIRAEVVDTLYESPISHLVPDGLRLEIKPLAQFLYGDVLFRGVVHTDSALICPWLIDPIPGLHLIMGCARVGCATRAGTRQ